MSASLARRAFTATARRSVLKPVLSPSASRVACRKISTSSSHGSETASDKPWVIGSLLIFGPALLYLLSPSARKSHHSEHSPAHSHNDHSKVKEENVPEPELMKDDEGSVADVTSSVTLAESNDVPSDAQPAEKQAEFKAAAEDDSSKPVEHDLAATPPTTEEGEISEKAETAKAGDGDRKLPKEPTNTGEAHESAVEPKEGSERKN